MISKGLGITVLVATVAATMPAGSQPRLIETVRGEVRKQLPIGRLIPGSLVTVAIAPVPPARGQTRSTITGWDGFYYFQDVPPGSYSITVTEKGKPPQIFHADFREAPTTDVPPIILPAQLTDYRTAYINALRSIDLEDWSGAVFILQQLVKLHPETARTRMEQIQTLGTRRDPYRDLYRPHFHLGYALQKLGDCDGALREWKEEESLGELNSRHKQVIQEGRRACSHKK
jgi:hypothetical protein